MRLTFLAVVLTGCMGGGGGGMVCPAPGGAPCCDPPDVTCPAGSTHEIKGGEEHCVDPSGARVGPWVRRDGDSGMPGAYSDGDTLTTCSERGWVQTIRDDSGDVPCVAGCWSLDGEPTTSRGCTPGGLTWCEG